MRLKTFARECDEIARTPSDNGKRDIIADVLHRENPEDAVIFTRMLLAEPFDDPGKSTDVGTSTLYRAVGRVLGIHESVVAELADARGKPELGVEMVFMTERGSGEDFESELELASIYDTIETLSETAGTDAKIVLLRKLFSECETPKEAKWVTYCIIGQLSFGVGDGIVRDAISRAFGRSRSEVDRAFALLGNVPRIVKEVKVGGELPLEPVPGYPFRPPLCANVDLARGGAWMFEPKIDGARILIHCDGESLRFFTRNRIEVTESLPELRLAFSNDREFILDGEAVAYDAESGEEFEDSYRKTMKRFRRERDISSMMQDILIKVYLFDIVHLDGEHLGDEPLPKRQEVLREEIEDFASDEVRHIPKWDRVSNFRARGNDSIVITPISFQEERMFDRSLELGHEGTIAKHMVTEYPYGERSRDWRKHKPSATIDLEVIDWKSLGSEENPDWLGSIKLQTSDGVSVGWVGNGFSDDFRAEYSDPDSIIGEIVEVRADEIQDDLRFPRFIALRTDKSRADSLSKVIDVLGGEVEVDEIPEVDASEISRDELPIQSFSDVIQSDESEWRHIPKTGKYGIGKWVHESGVILAARGPNKERLTLFPPYDGDIRKVEQLDSTHDENADKMARVIVST